VDGRPIELVVYDDHSSAADAVRAFQRLVNQDHVVAVVGSYVSEVVLALGPWANRLHTPLLTPGAASDDISLHVHEAYEANKFTFHAYLTSAALALQVCDAAKGLLVDGLHMQTAVIFSEDAAWTKPLDAGYQDCLPKIGLKVLDEVRFSPDTTDFTPIFNKLEAEKPDVIITGIAHVGSQPTVQWAQQQVPVPMLGVSAQATSGSFWKNTNASAEGVVFTTVAADTAAITPKTIPFAQAYTKRYGIAPAYTGYTADDDVHVIADAIHRAGGTGDPDKLVTALEATNYEGTIGRVAFYGRDERFTHSLRFGPDYINGLVQQWHDGKQVTVWPPKVAEQRMQFPAFIKLKQAAN
jgi:branched-chain amino acid transport system substrate-binding protein